MTSTRQVVLFACVHNAGRSLMAASFFNQLAVPKKARALSAGTRRAARANRHVDADFARPFGSRRSSPNQGDVDGQGKSRCNNDDRRRPQAEHHERPDAHFFPLTPREREDEHRGE
jgi:hypothetical protein